MICLGGPIFLGSAKSAGAGESHGVKVFDPELLVRKHVEKGFKAAYAPQLKITETDMIKTARGLFEDAGIPFPTIMGTSPIGPELVITGLEGERREPSLAR